MDIVLPAPTVPPPSEETWRDTVRMLVQDRSRILPDDVIEWLAVNTQTPAQTEKTLDALLREARKHGVSPNAEFAHRLHASVRWPTVATIRGTVADYFGLRSGQLTGPSRVAPVARARHIAMYLARKWCTGPNGKPVSYPEIGKRFGGRDHSTVITSCRKIERLVAEDAAVRRTVEEIEQQLGLLHSPTSRP